MKSRKPGDTRVGKQSPRYTFLLNPYSDARFSKCPKCEGKTGQKKLPLVIHVKDLGGPVCLNKTCRYCPRCDLLIAHQDEVEPLLARLVGKPEAKLSKDDYLVLGSIDKVDWKRGVSGTLVLEDLIAALHDFKEVVTVKPMGGWVREGGSASA